MTPKYFLFIHGARSKLGDSWSELAGIKMTRVYAGIYMFIYLGDMQQIDLMFAPVCLTHMTLQFTGIVCLCIRFDECKSISRTKWYYTYSSRCNC
jgi:hypothetical protein